MSIAGVPLFLQRVPIDQIIDLRHRVLRIGMPRASAIFERDHDPNCLHFAAMLGTPTGPAVCCATFHPDQWESTPAWRLRGMASDAPHRNKGLGRALLGFAEQTLHASAPATRALWCNARLVAVPFYQSQGWTVVSPLFDIPTAGPHHVMVKHLPDLSG
jgi:GNAT superfamily N-acetyltransferase